MDPRRVRRQVPGTTIIEAVPGRKDQMHNMAQCMKENGPWHCLSRPTTVHSCMVNDCDYYEFIQGAGEPLCAFGQYEPWLSCQMPSGSFTISGINLEPLFIFCFQ